MTQAYKLVWNGYHYFPYEREFARREVKALLGTAGTEIEGGILVEPDDVELATSKLHRLTYFRYVILPDGARLIPDQTRLELSSLAHSEQGLDSPLTRQSTRYSAHGLHEYRGKFNPQVVRAIGNMLSIPEGAWVLDPFCGSGTTLLECAHAGWSAVGIDLNPLGVFISNSKVAARHLPAEALRETSDVISQRLRARAGTLDPDLEWSERENELVAGECWVDALPSFDYLSRWFPKPVLAQVAAILGEINRAPLQQAKPVFLAVLSDILREVSYQDPGDLRIRRRKNPQPNYPAIPLFIERLRRKIESVTSAAGVCRETKTEQTAFVGDSRLSLGWITQTMPAMKHGLFDAAITSPPYATALPYVDTQRLSLCVLGLAASCDIMGLDRKMIGTREILDSRRRELDSMIESSDGSSIGPAAKSLCRRMSEMVSSSDGFRRRNMPALTFSYFQDMAMVLRHVRDALKPWGTFALIVGPNRTVLGGHPVVIDTPSLLADTAASNGWDVVDILTLDAYQRYDVHQRNSIKTESLVLLKKRS